MRRAAFVGWVAFGLTVIAGCGGTDQGADMSASIPGSTQTAPMAPPETTPTTIPPQTTPVAAPAALMPNVVGMNLQDAQNTIQEAGVFFSRSFDATGADRSQVLDSNWYVVCQTPAPGAPISEGDANLGAVKYGETGAC